LEDHVDPVICFTGCRELFGGGADQCLLHLSPAGCQVSVVPDSKIGDWNTVLLTQIWNFNVKSHFLSIFFMKQAIFAF
jgi:hypothetical protein